MRSVYFDEAKAKRCGGHRLETLCPNYSCNDIFSVSFVLVLYRRADSAHEDNTVKMFTKPSIYKDLLLSAVFSDSIHSSSRKGIGLSSPLV